MVHRVRFKAQKQYFGLGTETYARDYDNLIAFMSVSSIILIMMEFLHRYEADLRSLGDLYRQTCEQMQDIPYQEALASLMRLFISIPSDLNQADLLKKGYLSKAEYLINEFLSSWFNGVCTFIRQVIPLPLCSKQQINTRF